MRTRILDYLRTQHLGLIALVLVVGGGTAYAAGLAKDSVKSKQIKNGQVKSVDVKDQNLTGFDIADGSVGSSEVADGSIAAAEILDGAVGSPGIGDDAVTAAEIANDAVIGQKIATGVIGGGKLTPGAVSRNKIEDGAVDGTKVEDATLSGVDIADASIGQADLDPASVADVVSKAATVPDDGALRDLMAIPGFGTLQASCGPAANTYGVTYTFDPATAQHVEIFGHDPLDNSPVGLNPSNGPGPIGFGGAGFGFLDGYVWAYTPERVLRIDYTAFIVGGGNCSYEARATVDRNEP